MTGHSSSRASVLSPREIWPICSTRLSVRPSAAHQLEVVDQDQPEPVRMLLEQPPRLGADVEHREVGRVVDEQRRLREPVRRLHDLAPARRGHLALAQVVALDRRLRRDEALGELGLRHLEREQRDGLLGLERGVLGEVRHQRAVVDDDVVRDEVVVARDVRSKVSCAPSGAIETISSHQTSEAARSRSGASSRRIGERGEQRPREPARPDVPVVVARTAAPRAHAGPAALALRRERRRPDSGGIVSTYRLRNGADARCSPHALQLALLADDVDAGREGVEVRLAGDQHLAGDCVGALVDRRDAGGGSSRRMPSRSSRCWTSWASCSLIVV